MTKLGGHKDHRLMTREHVNISQILKMRTGKSSAYKKRKYKNEGKIEGLVVYVNRNKRS